MKPEAKQERKEDCGAGGLDAGGEGSEILGDVLQARAHHSAPCLL